MERSQALMALQSRDHGDLLNIIDDLRSQGINHYVDLPQIIVCGDQSSGKSSVLEAVSGFQFPRKDNLCTRFATEVILRRSAEESANVVIVAGDDRTEEEKSRLSAFLKKNVDLGHLEDLINEAKDVMGLEGEARAFSRDVLRIEVSGPSQPHLTLVDLPGLFRAGNRLQTDSDAEAVTSLVLSYMKKTRSIILAVVSAKNDFANQIVTKYARENDPEGARTLGIITKPDTLFAGSESETSFIDLAENKDVFLQLGWHVVRNRDFDTRLSSAGERDDAEREFFERGVWAHLPRAQVGISALKLRLSQLLRDQILSELPGLLEDVRSGVRECQITLAQLGTSRQSLAEQRLYLMRVSQDFTFLAKSAVDGNYTDSFFGSASTDLGAQKRLRAVVQNLLLEFARTMREKGHTKHIVEKLSSIERKTHSRLISRDDFVDVVLELMSRSRGRELPGTYNPHLISDLFFEQSRSWQRYTYIFMAKIWDSTEHVLDLILSHIADPTTTAELKRRIVMPASENVKASLDNAVKMLLEPHQTGHPITYNHYLTENIQKLRQGHQKKILSKKLDLFFGTNCNQGKTYCQEKSFDVKTLLDSLTLSTTADMDRYACSEAIDCMRAYYKVALKTFIDDIGILAVERCLLKKVAELLSPKCVVSLDDAQISGIASETEDSLNKRAQTTRKLKVLGDAYRILQSLYRSPTFDGEQGSAWRALDGQLDDIESLSEDDSLEQTRENAVKGISQRPSELDSDIDLEVPTAKTKKTQAVETTWAFGAENAYPHTDPDFWGGTQLIRSLGPVNATSAKKSRKKSKNTSGTLNGT